MSELSIKVHVANRVYPLSVQREEEEAVRKAAAMINEKIKEMESSYAVKDKQDLLAMVALQLATDKGHGTVHVEMETLQDKIKTLEAKIQEGINI